MERLKAHYRAIGSKTHYLQADLRENHRCHGQISKFASDMFYKSFVKPSKATIHISIPHGYKYPLVFVCTSMKQVQSYSSCINEEEADVIMKMLRKHVADGVQGVCVMSSSRSQVYIQHYAVVICQLMHQNVGRWFITFYCIM